MRPLVIKNRPVSYLFRQKAKHACLLRNRVSSRRNNVIRFKHTMLWIDAVYLQAIMERVLCLCGYAVSCLTKYRETGRLSELNGQLNELATATFVAASFLLTFTVRWCWLWWRHCLSVLVVRGSPSTTASACTLKNFPIFRSSCNMLTLLGCSHRYTS